MHKHLGFGSFLENSRNTKVIIYWTAQVAWVYNDSFRLQFSGTCMNQKIFKVRIKYILNGCHQDLCPVSI